MSCPRSKWKCGSFKDFLETFKTIEPLSDFQIIQKCKELKIKNFRGVFMRDELKGTADKNECLILNIDSSANSGTHWTCLFIKNNRYFYFDSFGFEEPSEILEYCKNCKEGYCSTFIVQKPGQIICGHFSIYMLLKLDQGKKFEEIVDELFRYNNK